MPWGFAAAAGAALVGGAISADASSSAANKQATAANNAQQTQLQMFNTLNQQQQPFRQTGYGALSQIAQGTGGTAPFASNDPNLDPAAALFNRDTINTRGYGLTQAEEQDPAFSGFIDTVRKSFNPSDPSFNQDNQKFSQTFQPQQPSSVGGVGAGQFTHQFDANDLKTNLAPNYDFMLQQGLGAATNALNASGGMGGNTLKGITDYAENYAGNAYQNAFSNYTANQTNIFNRLASVAGLGQTANGQAAQAGVPIAGAVGQAQMAQGQAQASGIVGQANALGGGINNAASWYTLGNVMNSGGNSSGSADPNFALDAGNSMALSG